MVIRSVLTAMLLTTAACNSGLGGGGSYFDERIDPILQPNCAGMLTGCHVDQDGSAAGNLDVESFDALMQRRDALVRFGPYPRSLLLMKAGDPESIRVNTVDPPDPTQPDVRWVTIETDIRHNAGSGFERGSEGFATIAQWLQAGHMRNGTQREYPVGDTGEECVSGIGVNDFEVNRFQSDGPVDDDVSFDRFREKVQPILRARCAGSNCHGQILRSLFLSCGDTDEELRWNYFITSWHLADPVYQSELLHRPLAFERGGDYHVGGDVFESTDDPDYQELEAWAEEFIERNPEVLIEDYATDGFRYFVNRVQPVLVRKGCLFMNCHSHVAVNQDLQLYVGSQGTFGRAAQHRNHGAGLGLLAMESPDPNQSRIIAKNLFPPSILEGGQGIAHRGGSLLEDFQGNPARPEMCDEYDVDNGDLNEIPAYCILARWQEVERGIAVDQGRILPNALLGLIWVERPLGVGRTSEFDTYRPGADLIYASASIGADQNIAIGAETSLLGGCGLTPDTADVRAPAVSWDGTRIAFAARSSADEPLRLYWMNDDGTDCERIPGVAADLPMENGILTHDFDPAFSPDNQIVFASTRGAVDRDRYDYVGPTRTPAAMEPNSNLYVFAPFADPPVRQLTFLLNQELSPSFTSIGRVIFEQEKRQPGFHQMALRQMNLDGGDFRPAFGARNTVGFSSSTEGVSMLTRDLAFIGAPLNAPDGAGMLVFANQTLGADQNDRDPADRFYLHAMTVPQPGFVGGAMGVYRSPAVLPSTRVLASCDLTAVSTADAPYDFDLCEIDPSTNTARVVAGRPGRAEVDAVALFARYLLPSEPIVPSDGEKLDRPDMEEGATDAIVLFHDFPMQIGLMFDNIRGPRIVDHRIEGFDVLEPLPPPTGTTTFADVSGEVITDDFGEMFVRQRMLGHVDLFADDSAIVRVPGGTPILWRPTDSSGTPLNFEPGSLFEGLPMIPREQDQYYPGERSQRSISRNLFNAICGFCHAGISGRELDVVVNVDALARASISNAVGEEPVDLYRPPAERADPE